MKKFYLKNYKVIHHILNLVFFILFLEIIGFDEIFTSIPFALMILLINYFIVKFSLRKSGLDEEVEKILRDEEDEEDEENI
jgi:hypothetical protein